MATFVLALVTMAAIITAQQYWAPIDSMFLTKADNAGWDMNLLLPGQEKLSLAIHGATFLSMALTVMSFLAMLASRPHLAAAPRDTDVSEGTLV